MQSTYKFVDNGVRSKLNTSIVNMGIEGYRNETTSPAKSGT